MQVELNAEQVAILTDALRRERRFLEGELELPRGGGDLWATELNRRWWLVDELFRLIHQPPHPPGPALRGRIGECDPRSTT